MKLEKIISGGQTGADRAGLEAAKSVGIETGGWAPRGYRTERGNDPTLAEFGLIETASSDYPTRTKLNVQNSDFTVWFGTTGSQGFWCTHRAILDYKKPDFMKFWKKNPTPEELAEIFNLFRVVNIAGNRASKNPEVYKQTFDTIIHAIILLKNG